MCRITEIVEDACTLSKPSASLPIEDESAIWSSSEDSTRSTHMPSRPPPTTGRYQPAATRLRPIPIRPKLPRVASRAYLRRRRPASPERPPTPSPSDSLESSSSPVEDFPPFSQEIADSVQAQCGSIPLLEHLLPTRSTRHFQRRAFPDFSDPTPITLRGIVDPDSKYGTSDSRNFKMSERERQDQAEMLDGRHPCLGTLDGICETPKNAASKMTTISRAGHKRELSMRETLQEMAVEEKERRLTGRLDLELLTNMARVVEKIERIAGRSSSV